MNELAVSQDSNSVLNSIRERITSTTPTGWQATTLGECFKWSSGGTPRRTEPTYFDGGIPWVVIGDLNDGVVTETGNTITEAGLANSAAKWVEPGSVLLAMYGSIGKLGIAGCRLTTNQAIAFTNPNPVDSKYLYYFLLWQRQSLARLGKGATQLNISQAVLKEFPFLLAPQAEQADIVAEIEKQFSRLDEAVAGLQRVKANLKRYKAAVLKSAVTGRLVPTEADLARREGRSYETGAELLQRILETRRSQWQGKGKYKEPAAPDTTDLPELPEGWVWAATEQICDPVASGSTPAPGAMFANSGDVPFIKVYNLTFDGTLDFTIKPTFVARETHEGMLARSRSLPGDVLINIVGPPLGKVSIVPDDHPEWNINQAVVTFRASAAILGQLLAYWLMSFPVHKRLERTAKATAGQFNLQVSTCRRLAIPLPPLPEQHRIVAEVDRLLSIAREAEAEVDANLKRAQGLRAAVLQRAFTPPAAEQPSAEVIDLKAARKSNPASERHFARALLSAKIVHDLHQEATFGRVKHQKIFHLCEHMARIEAIQGQYYREAAGPLDNKLIYANEAELKKQGWYEPANRDAFGHSYRPLAKAGGHLKYLNCFSQEQLSMIERLIELMRHWKTERCEIFSTAFAAWNDLVLWGKPITDDAILHEILNCWHDSKRRIPESRWRSAIGWMRQQGFIPSGFGKPTIHTAG